MKRIIFSVLMVFALVAATPELPGYEVGDKAIDFKLKNVDGQLVSLADWKDARGYIIIFDCNTCPYSKAYNERIIALHAKYAPLGFPLVAINANDPESSKGDSYANMISYARKHGYQFPYLIDETQEIARTYGATNTPHVYVLQRQGSDLQVAYIGAIDDNARDAKGVTRRYVEEAIDALLAGKPVVTTRTKAIGCGIKWKNS
ncbi:MAG: thioredoxin family protein [Cyclobacteriaceae bacterium]|nr:thioredoxin family protein [Cytophagales bacterium]HNP75648.1 thioredoxin family protein [Cyclobacteriaceae bacterium]HQQ81919.1 thioredoxin family protein [Cyclobacteriaceae bacterium]